MYMIEIAIWDDDMDFCKEIETILKKQKPFNGTYNFIFFQSGMALIKNTNIRFYILFREQMHSA